MAHFLDQIWIFFGYESEKDASKTARQNEIAMETFRQKMNMNRASAVNGIPTARGFDYMHWKPHGQHRVRVNHEDDFVIQCRGLMPYVQTAADSIWYGREEMHWAGLSRPEPPRPLGYGMSNSRLASRAVSREMLNL